MPQETPYFSRLAAAYVRGKLGWNAPSSLPADLLNAALEELSETQHETLIARGLAAR